MPIALHIPENEIWDYRNEQFLPVPETTIHVEHSLAAISKWEARWKKPFLTCPKLEGDELIDYIRCMTIENLEELSPNIFYALSSENYNQINELLDDTMTATTFKDDKAKSGRKRAGPIITAEIIYYQMVELGIPFECETWHFNKLLTLIRVCSEKQAIPKKMSRKEIFSQNAALNAQRKARLGSRG